MIRKKWFVIAVIVWGCGSDPAPHDYIASYGIEIVYNETVIRYEPEIINGIIHDTILHFGEIPLLENARVIFEGKPLGYSEGRVVAGRCYTGGVKRVYTSSICLARTSFAHEILHLWELYLQGDFDYNHEQEHWGRLSAIRTEQVENFCE